MEEIEYQVKSFMDVTASSPETAKNFISNAKFELGVAIDAFYERYAPIAFASSDEFHDAVIEINDNGHFAQKRGLKRQINDDRDPLLISSDEEDDVIFVSEQKAKVAKLEEELNPWPSKATTSTREDPWCSTASSSSRDDPVKRTKRKILIDGSNVAIAYAKALHGKKYNKHNRDAFSVEGLEVCVNYFKNLGFDVRVIVPEYRLHHQKSSNCRLIHKMKEEGVLVATPAKSYDDGILLEGAVRTNAAVVSNDFFRDLKGKGFDEVINSRIIRFNFLFNEMILAEDPYGRNGPKLNDILYCDED